MEELKACPFCGELPKVYGSESTGVTVQCQTALCGAGDDLIGFGYWQERAIEANLLSLIKRAEGVIRFHRKYAMEHDCNYNLWSKFDDEGKKLLTELEEAWKESE